MLTVPGAAEVVTQYFDALSRRDVEAMAAAWAPDGQEHIASQVDAVGPNGVREYFGELFTAFPDFALTVETTVAEDDKVAVHWTATATMTGPLWSLEPTGAHIELEGIDLLRVADGKIVRNDAVPDGMALARQIGLVPPAGSALEHRLFSAFNARTKATRRAAAKSELERVADGVWLLRGGVPRTMNVYLLEDEGGGVTLFDAGIRSMTHAIATAAAPLGGINRVVLGHADADHRGAAPGLGVPVHCHPADREAAEAEASVRAYHRIERLGIPARWVYPRLLEFWDGGAVEIAGTVEEGDDISGFRVVHLPGHAPGLIGLFRERDRLALTTDCFYVIDPETSLKRPPGPSHEAFNESTEQARESMRKLAALDPSAAWPGHADPLTGDVRAQLERAAGP
jgi:glyoxylase-like metal-dependent hydrolase (beta-lactamase superfamily II)/predicted ester cyclase